MKQIWRLSVLILLVGSCPILLHGHVQTNETIVIDSDLADYGNDSLALNGNVVIEHSLGVMSANQITLHQAKDKEKGQFGPMLMKDQVKFVLKEGGELAAGLAEFDLNKQIGHFSGNESQQEVVYLENGSDKKRDDEALAERDVKATSLEVKSLFMTIELASKRLMKQESARNHVRTITAEGQVMANYNDDFTLTADHATYLQKAVPMDQTKMKVLPGLLTMTSQNEDNRCQVASQKGDKIWATKITVDTIERTLHFVLPKGRLFAGEEAEKIEFSAESLVWEEPLGQLFLQMNVEVTQPGIGKLEATDEVCVFQDLNHPNKTVKAIEAKGDTHLSYQSEGDKNWHHLRCGGTVKIDHEKLQTRLVGLKESSGVVLSVNQVHFEDAKGEIFADKVLVKYHMVGRKIVLAKIVLFGNVKITNRLESEEDETIVVLQYVLADRVDFTPDTKQMTFSSSNKKHRVLFYDKMNSLQVSAPSLKITRDKATKKEMIEGMGDVRFSFLESEFEQLRKRFSWNSVVKNGVQKGSDEFFTEED